MEWVRLELTTTSLRPVVLPLNYHSEWGRSDLNAQDPVSPYSDGQT